jgi:GT2 family glycosyltransferase
MAALPASVIVVSRHRAQALQRCLVALTQQDHPQFEVIVVADPQAARQVQALGLPIKLAVYDDANISAARNLGLGLAAAPVVAFIDDDAVAEPTWLSRLTLPFDDPQTIAATGFVRGRNGISYQWQACEVDAMAQDHPLDIAGNTLRQGTPVRAVKTQGTNCAFRRDALLQIGGFDPAYRFFLDEADVNLRLAPHGLTAIIPGAQVHHGYQASARRSANRVPLSLQEIAASTAVFLRRHAPFADMGAALHHLTTQQAARAANHRAAGRIDAATEAALMASLSHGWAEGAARPLSALMPLPTPTAPLQPLTTGQPRPGCLIAGRIWQKSRLLRQAREAVAAGQIVTVICLAPTPRVHRMEFMAEGFWLQSGGLFGRSTRTGPRLRLIGFTSRIAEEARRIADFRPIC